MKIFQSIIFTILMIGVFGGCRKPADLTSSDFVKLFPNDSSYQAGGGFQLANGNFVIYGFDGYNSGVDPIIIITDQHGTVIRSKKLSSKFHYVTIKPIMSNTKMMAVGVENFESVTESVCVIEADGTPGTIWEYEINSVRVNIGTLPDFVEDSAGYVISGYGTDPAIQNNVRLVPFVLRIGKAGDSIKLTKYAPETGYDFNKFCTNICQWENGFALCGYGNWKEHPYKGMFYMKLDKDCALVWDTIIFDNVEGLSLFLVDSSGGATVLCGSEKGTTLNGILCTRWAFHNEALGKDSLGEKHFYYGYENLARFISISRTSDGGYILSAVIGIIEGSIIDFHPQFYILKINSALEYEWSRIFNSYPSYNIASVVQTNDGGYLLCGLEHTASYVYTMVMIKTDANGNIVPD